MSGSATFPTTRWHLLRCAASLNPSERGAALEELAQLYWEPLYIYVRRLGRDRHECEDLLQSFLLRFCEAGSFSAAEAERGRFRTFLLASLNHFACDVWRHDQITTRRPPGGWVALDMTGVEQSVLLDNSVTGPDVEFDRNWLRGILARCMESVRLHYAKKGRAALGEHLCARLAGDPSAEDHAQAAERLGLAHTAVRQEMTRARQHLRNLVLTEVAATVESPQEVEEELRHLFAVWDKR